MRIPALGEAAIQLAWLCPGAASLAALARLPIATAWSEIRSDPGAVLLVVRETSAARSLPFFLPSLLHDPAILDSALGYLDQPGCFVNWSGPAIRPIYEACLRCAQLAQHLAERTARCDPDNAWVAGLLAPLGWLAVCAVEPEQAVRCLEDPAHAAQPAVTQQKHWGHDHAALARRLARRWRLPDWLVAVTGHLGLPVELAQQFGADPHLFQTVQLAVGLAQQQHGVRLGLAVGATPAEAATALGLPEDCGVEIAERGSADRLQSPAEVPLLRDLLRLAAENRRWREAPPLRRLESDVDDLHRALEEQRAGEAERLLAQKLTALAEFAAGAGHEINNPLAVISGQAQYLLQHEADESRRRALQIIVQQCQRIHQTLRDLMQFARPPKPHRQATDPLSVVQEVVVSLRELAEQRRVQVQIDESLPVGPTWFLDGDPTQVRTMVTCLLRNAIEAAPADGWARVRLETAAPEWVEIVVEDSGPGPSASQQEHLFDPFYSGRPAGRGRGLGLPITWRLAREHGGEVCFVHQAEGPTRFILRLPRHDNSQPLAA